MRTLLRFVVGGLGVVLLAPGCTESVRRAGLVPHQQPIAHSGSQLEHSEFSVGSPTLARSSAPTLTEGENAGIVIPRWTGQGGIRIPLPFAKQVSFGIHGEYGSGTGATALSKDQPETKGNVVGGALSMLTSIEVSPRWDIGLGGQFWVYSVPYTEYRTCVDCQFGYTSVAHKRELTSVVSVGIIPTYKVNSEVSVFGGVNLRNHPTIEKSSIEQTQIFEDEAVEFGPANTILSLGADIMVSERLKVTGYLHRPMASRPATYGTSAGVMLTVLGPKPKDDVRLPFGVAPAP